MVWILNSFFFVSLFHFMLLRCVRVFGEETGKTRRKEGRCFGEGQLNDVGLVSTACQIGSVEGPKI
jgi:hypothetical protein